MWTGAVLAFLGAMVGALISHFGLRYAERQRRLTRFDSERLDAYSTYIGSADMVVFQSCYPNLENRLAQLEAELNRMRTTVGRVQLLAKTPETRQTAYVLLEACNSLHSLVVQRGSIALKEADSVTTEPMRNFLAAARAELEIEDPS